MADGWQPGMRLEARDRLTAGFICVANIGNIIPETNYSVRGTC